MKQRFTPYGTVSSRPEFGRHGGAEGAEYAALMDALIEPLEAFDVDDGVFALAWEMASMQPGLNRAQRRAALLLVLVTLAQLRQGSTCLPLAELEPQLEALLDERACARLELGPARVREHIARMLDAGQLEALVGPRHEDVYRPLVLEAGRLYHQRMLHYEGELLDALSERIFGQVASIQIDGLPDHLEAVWSGAGQIELTPEQRYAVLTAVHEPLTLITGGPGTGKTSIVVALLRLMTRLGVEPAQIALAAPTGKAANRMLESIEGQLKEMGPPPGPDQALLERLPKPQTLHRLLGYSRYTRRFHHHQHNQLEARAVIVDEASMIDIFLMERLVRAVRPEAHLVLLGDADQLPSVDAGAVLRDLIAAEPTHDGPWRELLTDAPEPRPGHGGPMDRATVHLTRSHRMRADDPAGRNILSVARRIRAGRADQMLGEELDQLRPRASVEELTHEGAEWLELDLAVHDVRAARERLRPLLDHWYAQHLGADPTQLAGRTLQGFDDDALVAPDETSSTSPQPVRRAAQRARLLCRDEGATPRGRRALNEAFVERMSALRTWALRRGHDPFLPGTPGDDVAQRLRPRNMFNGDQGIMLAGAPGSARVEKMRRDLPARRDLRGLRTSSGLRAHAGTLVSR